MSYVKAPRRLASLLLGPCLIALASVLQLAQPFAARAESGLSYDGDHDVVILPKCDVAVRFNNKTFVPVKAKLLDASASAFLKIPPDQSIRIWEDYESAKMAAIPEQILVQVYDVSKVGAFSSSRFNKDFVAANRVREVQFTNERVAKETGLSESAFSGITAVKSFEVTPKSGETPYYLYAIQTPEHLTMFARKMRATSRTFDLDPAVIVTQIRVRGVKDCVGNVKLEETPVLTQ